jgi:hypothetical protein
MPDRPFALSLVPPLPPAEDDYDAICATMMESARGRWFLDEYARRNRNADTALVLAAIERVESAIRGERDQQPYQSFRTQLLEMAKAITMTRAEVTEIGPQAQARDKGPEAPPANVQASPQILGTAERIADVAWTMRERGFDPKTCDQIEALAASILSVPFLRDTDDQRTHQLSEVLVYLERRVNTMLEAYGSAPSVEAQAPSEPSATSPPSNLVALGASETGPAANQPAEREPTRLAAVPVEDAAAVSDTPAESKLDSATVAAHGAESAEPANESPSPLETTATDDTTSPTSAPVAPMSMEAAASLTAEPEMTSAEPADEAPPTLTAEPAEAAIDRPLAPMAPASPDAPAAAAAETALFDAGHPGEPPSAETEASARLTPEPSRIEAPNASEPALYTPAGPIETLRETDAPISEPEPADFLLEPMSLPVSSTLPALPAAAAAAEPPAESTVPEPSVDIVTQTEEEPLVLAPAEPAHDAPAEQPTSSAAPPSPSLEQVASPAVPAEEAAAEPVAAAVAPAQPVARPTPRPATSGPLAALKAMSDEERIALFT